ncbi:MULTISPECIES: bifunctional UDP-N-acetylglucosamine diphosphorylase/glucosamine-1-phosphate N-acetyltransferase GlmU [Candidatus Ichthyocystis]|uniref:bifunctional UDP-N-acetylglucosamine diphosphorylase/glucosamine-1-phosphate N-acetyltransferase GlmU n=1 Tax=Candidatus Ichthyocystis TaxID=2929841 RepID=UPI000AE77736|nr:MULTISPECIES: bifunctional UDP-N-acetylglucosamine diphosphorylase/glucosamine-1-phosphate N-acetyltransferase GlmU [Ichthyocystis]
MNIIILAAGRSTRMRSHKPKVLQPLAGVPIISHIVETVQTIGAHRVVIVCGKNKKDLQSLVGKDSILWAEQDEPTGTGSAALIGLNLIDNDDVCLILCADMPLVSAPTLQKTVNFHNQKKASLTLVTESLSDPSHYGRIIRDKNNKIIDIIEEKDANLEEKKINEVNCGIYCSGTTMLRRWLTSLEAHNRQGEYYLTDIVRKASLEKVAVESISPENPYEILGINDAKQLEQVERRLQKNRAEHLMAHGTRLADSSRIDIRGVLKCDEDVFIDINCVFVGKVHLGKNVTVGPNCYIRDSTIQDNSEILPNSIIEGSTVGMNSSIGPFARIRPCTNLQHHTKIGNFVEVKNSSIGDGCKINHLSYIGDATIGTQVLVGAGTITCNFDGHKKNPTHIGNDSFIGSGTQLIAPISIGSNATIGAGSTITKNVPNQSIATSRIHQKVISKRKIKS